MRARSGLAPLVGLVLGSGLGDLADELVDRTVIPYAAIPNHPSSGAAGHAGKLVLGRLEGVPVAAWQGRAHFYEGWSMGQAAFPIRLLAYLGARAVVLTNAAGGLRADLAAGDLLLLTDHVNLPGLAGHGPLRGPAEPGLERFVDLSAAYDPALAALAIRSAQQLGFALPTGVYAMVAGPNYETPAEARLLRLLGADAVGMSTVPEVIVARQVGLRVLALSAITNALGAAPGEAPTSHAEVLAAAARLKPRFGGLVRRVVAGMPEVLGCA